MTSWLKSTAAITKNKNCILLVLSAYLRPFSYVDQTLPNHVDNRLIVKYIVNILYIYIPAIVARKTQTSEITVNLGHIVENNMKGPFFSCRAGTIPYTNAH